MSVHTAFLPSARTLDFDPATGEFVLHISARDRDLAASVPGLRFHKPSETWRGVPTLACAFALRGVFGNALDVTPAAYAAVQPEVDKALAVRAVKNGEQTCPAAADPRLEGLLDMQKEASWAAVLQRGFIIGDEKGTGKTVEACGALNIAESPFPALVVCTTSMKHTWAAEISKWTGASVEVAGRTKAQRQKAIRSGADVVIVGWEQLRTESYLAPYGSTRRTEKELEPGALNEVPWRTVIADEAHRAKQPKAKQTRALWAVSANAEYRIALTATPITSGTLDMWAILHFIRPQDWPSRSRFQDRYVLTSTNPWGGVDDLGLDPRHEDEFRSMFEPYYMRRKRDFGVKALAPQFRFVDMEGEQRRVYKQFEKDSLVRVDDRFLVAVGPMLVNNRLQQLAQATPVLTEEGNLEGFRLPSCKYDALVDLLDEMDGEPLVVFSDSRLLLEMCYTELTKDKGRFTPEQVGRVYGGIPAHERTATVERFQTGTMPLILCSIGAGAEGITLTAASTLCFLNRSYRAVMNNQAEGRVLRHGQTRDVQIIDIVTRESEEYRVHESGLYKEERLQQIVQDEDYTPRLLPNKEEITNAETAPAY